MSPLLAALLTIIMSCAVSAQEARRTSAIVAPLVDLWWEENGVEGASGAEALELVQLEETVTISYDDLHRHIFVDVSPVWGDLAGPVGTSLEWTACGGQFRSQWAIAFEQDAYPEVLKMFNDARRHLRCGVASSSLCTPLDALNGSRSHGPGRFSTFVASAMSRLSAATSSVLEWRPSTPQHQRPLGLAQFNMTDVQCRAVLAPESTLCTQHMVTIFGGGGADSVMDKLSVTFPEVLSTAWHQLSLQIRHTANRVAVTKRLSFVASGLLAEWMRVTTPSNLDNATIAPRTTAPPSSIEQSDWHVRWKTRSESDAGGVIEVEVIPPLLHHTSLTQQREQDARSIMNTTLLLTFPTTVLRPLLQVVDSGMHKGLHVVRVLHDHELATLCIIINITSAAYQLHGSSLRATITLPYIAVFGTLAERPPDANKHYSLPQPLLHVPGLCTTEGSAAPHVSAWQQLFPSQCGEWYRTPAELTIQLSLPVPDSAMVFNAVSIALLPFSVLLGTILRRTGRDV